VHFATKKSPSRRSESLVSTSSVAAALMRCSPAMSCVRSALSYPYHSRRLFPFRNPAYWDERSRPSGHDVHHRSSVHYLLRYPSCVGALFRGLQIGSSRPSLFSMSCRCASPSLAYHFACYQSVTVVDCAVRSSGLDFSLASRILQVVLFALPSGNTKKARHSSWSFPAPIFATGMDELNPTPAHLENEATTAVVTTRKPPSGARLSASIVWESSLDTCII
jgi:hypothetical protein